MRTHDLLPLSERGAAHPHTFKKIPHRSILLMGKLDRKVITLLAVRNLKTL